MKKIISLLAVMMMLSTAIAAPKSKKEVVTREFTTDIHCEMCVKKVMNVLPFQKGVKDVDIDLKTKVIKVDYDASKTTDENIVASLAKLDVNTICETK